MDTLHANSEFSLVGTWRGLKSEDMPLALQRLSLAEQLDAVREEFPGYVHHPAVHSAWCKARDLMLKAYVPRPLRSALLEFWGKSQELPILLRHLSRYVKDEFELSAICNSVDQLLSARVKRLYDMVTKEAALGFTTEQAFYQHNRILDSFSLTLSNLLRGVSPVGDYLQVGGVSLGANYATPASTQTSLGNQIGGNKAPDANTYTGYQTTFFTGFKPVDNNGLATVIDTVVNGTEFTVLDATGLLSGDAIEVAGFKRIVLSVVGLTVVVTEAIPALGTHVGKPVIQCWGESGLRINTGLILGTRSRFEEGGFPKTNSIALFVESGVTLRPVGV
jgi:hypothetical protein